MSDIVERLRGLRFVHVPVASQLMEEAAREIERLRLTADEREAIQWFSQLSYGEGGRVPDYAATLRKLLERLK